MTSGMILTFGALVSSQFYHRDDLEQVWRDRHATLELIRIKSVKIINGISYSEVIFCDWNNFSEGKEKFYQFIYAEPEENSQIDINAFPTVTKDGMVECIEIKDISKL